MDSVTQRAYAKINLGLDIVGLLPNGYHEVRMIMQNVNLYDTLTFSENESGQIEITTDESELPVTRDNLIYQAVLLLRKLSGDNRGVRIHLEKRIPIAAGMAGGSADAAATLLGVNRLLGLGFDRAFLQEKSVAIGADVPYCVLGRTALAEGIGERLTAIAAPPPAHLVIAKPDIQVSTRTVYHKFDSMDCYTHPDIDGMLDAIAAGSLAGITDRLGNVLEPVTAGEYPIIREMKAQMMKNGAMGALMSGSGPSVFGIFDDECKARQAYDGLKESGYARQLFLTEFANAV